MDDLLNLIRREVMRAMSLHSRPRTGTISSYDPDAHAVKVMLQPENKETGWIPLATSHIGNGFGVAIGPEIGDQVEIGFQQDDPDTPRVTARLFSDKDKPPRVEAGEIVMKHKTGSTFFIDKDGNVHVKSSGNVYINGSGETP